MYDKIFQQADEFFKPMNEIMAINARTLDELTQKQTALVSEVMKDSMSFAQGFSEKRDVEDFYTSQKAYWETMNRRFTEAAKESYELISDAQEKMSSLWQDSLTSVTGSMAESAKSNVRSAASSTKTAAKSASKTAAKTGKKAEKAAEETAEATTTASKS